MSQMVREQIETFVNPTSPYEMAELIVVKDLVVDSSNLRNSPKSIWLSSFCRTENIILFLGPNSESQSVQWSYKCLFRNI